MSDAHAFALSHHLWSHALLLSQYLSFGAFQETVTKYAMSFHEVYGLTVILSILFDVSLVLV